MIYVSYGEVDQEGGRFNEDRCFIASKKETVNSLAGKFTVHLYAFVMQ